MSDNMRLKRNRGFTLLELMAAMAILGVTATITGYNLMSLHDPLEAAANQMTSNLKLARARAMATTAAYRILPTSSNQIMAQYGTDCSATSWTDDTQLSLDLEDPISVSTGWSFCFNSRGTVTTAPASTIVLNSTEAGAGSTEILVYLGGAVQAQHLP